MSPAAQQILNLAARARLSIHDEKRAQAEFAAALEAAGIQAEREVALGDGDIVDFMVGGIAVEMKVQGQRLAIYRQLERYARHERVEEIVLLTARCMHLPPAINGKPAAAGSLSRGYL